MKNCMGVNNSFYGHHHTIETKLKMRLVKLGKPSKLRGRRLSLGEKHPRWKGNDVGYISLHQWIYRHLGKPNLCQKCGSSVSNKFMWHNISGNYTRGLSDWQRLCSKCHANIHKNWEKRCY